jgi:hypothetical protein
MDRIAFIEKLFSVLTLGSIFLLAGWGKQEKVEGFGNEEKLWDLASGEERSEETVEINYAKKTPALFRDTSMGKEDPSFVPRVSGG